MEEFDKLMQTLKAIRTGCPCDIDRTSENIIECLKEELDEVKVEVESKDKEKIAQELGDLLWNVIFLIQSESEKYNFTHQEVISKINKKLIFRHPHIFENPQKLTKKEADLIWEEQKKKEKELNIIH